MFRKSIVTIALLPLLAGGCSNDPDPTLPIVCVGSGCADVGANDAQGVDPSDSGGGTLDGGADHLDGGEDGGGGGTCAPGTCPGDLVCNSATNTCVECVTNAECGESGVCDGDTNTCSCASGFHACDDACVEETSPDACGPNCEVCPSDPNGTRVCEQGSCLIECEPPLQYDAVGSRCIECFDNFDCPNAASPVCGDGTCTSCQDNVDCAHIPDRASCSAGECVECTVTDESACGPNSCDPFTGTCTSTPRGSVAACGSCVADSECAADHACVPMMFDGDLRSGGFCLPKPGNACSGLYGTQVMRTSLSGASGDYCTINESATTCEAITDYNTPCADASDCGAAGLDDGLCEPIDFEPARCTYRCDGIGECPSSSFIGCATGNLSGDKWCGAY